MFGSALNTASDYINIMECPRLSTNGAKYSKMDQVKFVKDSL